MTQTSSSLDRNPTAFARSRRVLIVRLSAMGDVIHAITSVSSLRAMLPECRIGWVIEKRWTPLLCAPGFTLAGERCEQRPLADEVFPLDIRYWRCHLSSAATWSEMRNHIAEIKKADYEIAVDLQGAIRSAAVARLSGAPVVWGDCCPRESPASMFYRHCVTASGKHVVEQNLELLSAAVKMPLRYTSPFLPRDPDSVEWCDKLLARRPGKFCILNPGAGWGAKCWPASSFGELARQLGELGIGSLVNFGPGEEALAQQVSEASGGTAEAISCSISQLIELMRRAEFFIGGDTGPMHLAAALRIPVVALFGPTNPARNGPFGTRNVVLRSQQSATSYRHTSQPDDALQAIQPAQVLAAIARVLQPAPWAAQEQKH